MENKENKRNLVLSDIQKWWEIPAIIQFIDLFGENLKIPEVDVDSLERMLLNRSVDPLKPEDKPIFIYLHGGYWQRLNKEVSAYCVSPLAEKGYRVIVMDYNLCPKVNLETVVSQVKEGVKHILKYAKITNAKELTLCGHSAGGHMFASLLDSDIENKDLIKHFVLISGIYDLKEIWHTKALSDLSNTVNPLGLNDETSIKLSPMYFKNFIKYDAEVHLLTGKYEAPSFFGQAKVFGDILKKQNYTVHLHEFPEYDHFDIVHSMKDVNSDITKYLFYILKI
ncbi:AFMID.2 family protein [Megaselia abdita]